MWRPGSCPCYSSFRALQKKWLRLTVLSAYQQKFVMLLQLCHYPLPGNRGLYTVLHDTAIGRAKCVRTLFKEWSCPTAPSTAQPILCLCARVTSGSDLWSLAGDSAWSSRAGRAVQQTCEGRRIHWRLEILLNHEQQTNNAYFCRDSLFHSMAIQRCLPFY